MYKCGRINNYVRLNCPSKNIVLIRNFVKSGHLLQSYIQRLVLKINVSNCQTRAYLLYCAQI